MLGLLLLPSIYYLAMIDVPVGSKLQVRMNTPVASWSSPVDTPISAVLIAPLAVKGQVAFPAGSTVSGRIRAVTRVGLGIRHERASLDLEFTRISLPSGKASPLQAQLTQIDNGRERVTATGVVQGIRATGSISYRVSGYIKTLLLWNCHAQLVEWFIKSLVVQLPEPEIDIPVGTELTLSTTRRMTAIVPEAEAPDAQEISGADFAGLQGLVASLPFRTVDPESGRDSDVTNILFVGSHEEILAAFRSAGWNVASTLSMRSRIGTIRAAAEMHGYAAPMSSLLLNDAEADMCLEKGLNDVSKRHHIRIWKQPYLWKGQELWLAAATRDINFAYLRPGRTFAHRIDPNIDDEREKVINDLAFTACARISCRVPRPNVPSSAQNGTGDAFTTDALLAVVRFSECLAPPSAMTAAHASPLITRGGKWQRLLRREVLVTRSDFIRANMYWRMFEAAGLAIGYMNRNKTDVQSGLFAQHEPKVEMSPTRQALSYALSLLQ